MDETRELDIESSPSLAATASTFLGDTPWTYISVIAAASAASARPHLAISSSGKYDPFLSLGISRVSSPTVVESPLSR